MKNSFIETFKDRGGATQEQIYFAEETAKIIFGELKEEIVPIIPAPCGFGKSSISFEILKKLIELIKNKKTTNGLILVTDRLDSLRDTQNELKELGLDRYTYILEGWNDQVCQNKKYKQSESKMCKNCPDIYSSKCKIRIQQYEQKKFPILLITNARLKECGTSIKQYAKYENGIRTILLVDEKHDILDTVKVNKALLNQISTEISKCEYSDVEEKTIIENKFKEIENMIISKMQKLRKSYKRFILSNINNEPICKTDEEFMAFWNKYMKNNFKHELNHIHTILTKGGFYVYEKNKEFISTIGCRDLRDMYSDTFKTIVFDGTALYDPLYLGMYDRGSIKFLDIKNTREYNNLTIYAYIKHKMTKTRFKNVKYQAKACGAFVNEKMRYNFENNAYVVTYQDYAGAIKKAMNKSYNIACLDQNQTYYFGNTKGRNDMKDCNKMFQFGWDTLPDYEYVIQWLSIYTNWAKVLEYCSDTEKAIRMSENLTVKERKEDNYGREKYSSLYKTYKFGYEAINQFKYFLIVTNFYQEVHRTKLRNYSFDEPVEVYVFSIKDIVFKMIEQLFSKCNFITINKELDCFKESKITGKETFDGRETIPQKIINWINNDWNGEEIRTKEMLKEINITQKQFDKSKEKNPDLKKIIDKYMVKRGIYKKIA